MACFPRERFIDATHVTRRVVVTPKDVVYVRGILEASDGVAAVFSEAGGDLTFVCSPSRVHELDELLRDLKEELAAAWLVGPLNP